MSAVLAYGLGFSAVLVAAMFAYALVSEILQGNLRKQVNYATVQLEDMFVTVPKTKLIIMHIVAPFAGALITFIMTNKLMFVPIGLAIGFMFPKVFILYTRSQRLKKFHNQIVDGLLVMSSSLRAGLSMTQAFSVVSEEMPPPISQEFGLVLKETRMGVNFDEALEHLQKRIPSDEVNMFVTTVLVARETGGDVTSIFTRLVETIRERKKIKEKIKTLTFMARLQGIIMGLLPFMFLSVTLSIDKKHLDFFMNDPTGKILILVIIGMQLFSMMLFVRFSRSPI